MFFCIPGRFHVGTGARGAMEGLQVCVSKTWSFSRQLLAHLMELPASKKTAPT